MKPLSVRPRKVTLTLLGIVIGVTLMVASSTVRPSVRLVYNASDSAPRGWYRIEPAASLRVGDLVVARLPRDIARFASTRGYLPSSVPVLKHIAATAGQRACVQQGVVTIDGIAFATTLAHDAQGRVLAPWSGCRSLQSHELFLLNTGHSASFDSRYFGPIDASFVIGKATRIPAASEP